MYVCKMLKRDIYTCDKHIIIDLKLYRNCNKGI